MLRFNQMFTMLLLLALILSACQPIQPVVPDTDTAVASSTQELAPQPHQPRSDAPTYGVRGPYAVGIRDFVIEPTSEITRPLSISVWYPALNPQGATESITYLVDFPGSVMPPMPVAGRAMADANLDPTNAPYPLVVFVHGQWMFRQQAIYLVEHLASHGFVVMAADYADNWGNIFTKPVHEDEITRQIDVKRQLDFAEQLTTVGNPLQGLIDMEHVAVTGHSFGGEVALQVGGARFNLVEWNEKFCVRHPGDPNDPFGDCQTYADHFVEMARLAGLESVPEGLWPDWRDPRVDAIAPLAPGGAAYFIGGGLDNVQLPVLLLIASTDSLVGAGIEYAQLYEALPSSHKSRVVFENADHFIFINECSANPGMATVGLDWACRDSVWDMTRIHDLTNHFVAAFLLAELKGDADAAKALTPENVTFPGIEYETTAYTTTTSAEPTTGYAEVNGTRLYYELAGTGDAVVLIHGFGADSRYWQAQFDALAEKYQVVRYDLRGFGKSALPGTEPYTHADDLKALLDYLGITQAHLIGHSFGGENAINFALAYPAATRSLILVDNDVQGAEGLPPSTPEEDAAWAVIFAALEKGDRRAAAEAVLDLHPLFVVARTMPTARDLQVAMFADYSWWHLTGGEDPVLPPKTPAAVRLGEIKAPTLVIIGELDNAYQHKMVEITVAGISGAQKVVMPGLDHSPFVEEPAGFNQLLFAFLAGK